MVAPPGDSTSRLLLARASNEAWRARVGDRTGGRAFLFLHNDDFERRLQADPRQGVRFVRPSRTQACGRVTGLQDLHGNLWDPAPPGAGADPRSSRACR